MMDARPGRLHVPAASEPPALKKLINRPESVVPEMLRGLLAIDPGLALLERHNVAVRADAERMRDRQVALLSGGGSGHEPAHAGYVGQGMLSAAVAGEVFTSPSSDAVFAAIQAVTGRPGALLIVKNYTGDRLNFGLAAEMARSEGLAVRIVVVADDVAIRNPGAAGARGLAGVVLVHKIAGAAAAEGGSLEEVSAAAEAAAECMGTMGLSFSAGVAPAAGKPSFILGESELELGLGIHGEPGVRRMPMEPADALTDTLVDSILAARGFSPDRPLVLMLNNLGSTTPMELAIAARRAYTHLTSRGWRVERVYSGAFLSSLDMAGISITLLEVDEERLRRLDSPTSAPGWPNVAKTSPARLEDRLWKERSPDRAHSPSGKKSAPQDPPHAAGSPQTASGKRAARAIRAACAAMLEAESELTALDQATGDGDLGASLARGARTVRDGLDSYPLDQLSETFALLGRALQSSLGGSSGPFYGVMFLRAAAALKGRDPAALATWAEAAAQGARAISELGGASAGDRTMLDALLPFAETLQAQAVASGNPLQALEAAVRSSEYGAAGTAQMLPRRGRSSYLGARVLGHPDPGAVALSRWLRAVARALAEKG